MKDLTDKVLDILINTKWMPLEIQVINKEFRNSINIPIKFYLNKKNKKLMKNIKNIKNIVMDTDFNELINLPQGLEVVNIGEKFNKKITIPDSVVYITYYIKYKLKILIPKSVIKIYVYNHKKRLFLPEDINYKPLKKRDINTLPKNTELYTIQYFTPERIIETERIMQRILARRLVVM
jgi:hypothetical protein